MDLMIPLLWFLGAALAWAVFWVIWLRSESANKGWVPIAALVLSLAGGYFLWTKDARLAPAAFFVGLFLGLVFAFQWMAKFGVEGSFRRALERRDYETAERICRLAIEGDRPVFGHSGLGDIALTQEHWDEAVDQFTQAELAGRPTAFKRRIKDIADVFDDDSRRLTPEGAVRRLNVAVCLAKAGRPEEAYPLARSVARAVPKAPGGHLHAAEIAIQAGRLDDARDHLASGRDRIPKEPNRKLRARFAEMADRCHAALEGLPESA